MTGRADSAPAAAVVERRGYCLDGQRVEIVEPFRATVAGLDLGPMWVCRARSGAEIALPAAWLRPLGQGP